MSNWRRPKPPEAKFQSKNFFSFNEEDVAWNNYDHRSKNELELLIDSELRDTVIGYFLATPYEEVTTEKISESSDMPKEDIAEFLGLMRTIYRATGSVKDGSYVWDCEPEKDWLLIRKELKDDEKHIEKELENRKDDDLPFRMNVRNLETSYEDSFQK